jgi:type I restriction enzyme S subunit
MSQPMLPRVWKWAKLSQLCEITGGGTPSRKVERYYQGHIPWVTVKDMVEGVFTLDDAQEHITEEAIESSVTHLIPAASVIAVTRVGLGKVVINSVPVAINQDLKALQAKRQVSARYLLFALHHYTWQYVRYGQGSTVKGVRQEDLLDLEIPFPPLLVQERIAEILQKVDGIRRKRQEALSLADTILSSAFIAMFSDPRENSRGFKVTPLGDLADVRSGVTKGRKLGSKETVKVPYLRVANVQDGFLDLAEIKTIAVLSEDLSKYRLEDGDILMTEGGDPDKLGRGCTWRSEVEGCIHQNHVFRVRTDQSCLSPDYLAALLRTQYAKEYSLRCAKCTSNLASINSTQVKAFPIPVPPITLHSKFATAVEQWEQINQRLTNGLGEGKRLFQGIIQQAFTGQLTAAWEATLEDEIAAGQSLYHFVSYKYGPFVRQLYHDLEALAAEGFLTVAESDEERTEIALDPSKELMVQEVIAQLPENLQADVMQVLEHYGS